MTTPSHVAVALLAGKAARIDAVALQLRVRRERGNLAALPCVRVKSPAVVRTFNRLPITVPRRKWKRPVRAHIAQRENLTRSISAYHERNFQPRRGRQRAPSNFIASQGGAPNWQLNVREQLDSGTSRARRKYPSRGSRNTKKKLGRCDLFRIRSTQMFATN